ncbi:MAG: hypothetical protein HY514_03855 [Candidatus Aenigmarchaeota archaeon]|nr:hypothetical protein [Candidatus Aenigmarchaeota archaeon]
MRRVIVELGYGPFAKPANDEQAVANLILGTARAAAAPVRLAENAYRDSRIFRGVTGLVLAGGLLLGALHYGKQYIPRGVRDAREIYNATMPELPTMPALPTLDYDSSVKPALKTVIREAAELYHTGRKEFSEQQEPRGKELKPLKNKKGTMEE